MVNVLLDLCCKITAFFGNMQKKLYFCNPNEKKHLHIHRTHAPLSGIIPIGSMQWFGVDITFPLGSSLCYARADPLAFAPAQDADGYPIRRSTVGGRTANANVVSQPAGWTIYIGCE